MLSAAIAIGAVSLLDLASPVGAALGVMIIPFVALATSRAVPEREDVKRDAWQPARGVCQCGHVMSMHCHADCSGPCAVQNCPCEGQ
jgi:DNA-binding transcriptional regulator YdaS (Cro superfamily)